MLNGYCFRRLVKRKLAFWLLVLFASLPVMADDVTINESTFPDQTFRNYVVSNIAGGDYTLTDAEAQAVTSLTLSSQGITDLTGIKYFTNLTELNCRSNSIKSLDVSGLTSLQTLDCSYNSITSLDVSSNTNLTYLDCGRMTNASLTSLTLGELTGITTLRCMENSLTSLDVSKLTSLETLRAESNSLTSLDVSKCAGLTTLRAEKNKLLVLKINSSASITDFSVDDQSVGGTSTLYYNSGNWYMTLPTAVDKESINSAEIDGEGTITYDTNQGDDNQLYISLTTDQIDAFSDGSATVEYNYATGNSNYTLDASLTTTLSSDDDIIINDTNFPDDNFRSFIATTFSKEEGDTLNIAERLGLTELSAGNKGIADATGIALFPNLTKLEVYSNAIKSLDVSSNTKLTYLDCSRMTNASLTSLNLGSLTGITALRCMENSLTYLDVSYLTSLDTLRAESNHLTALNLSNNSKVGTTSGRSNINSQTYPTRTLKYDPDKDEYYIILPNYIESKVSSITFTINSKSYSCTAEEDGDDIRLVIPLTGEEANKLSTNDKTLEYSYPTGSKSGNLTTMSVSMTLVYPSTEIVALTTANFSDSILAAIKKYDADSTEWLSNTELITIDSLNISGEGSNVNLKGLSHLTNLRYLNCSNDSLATVSLGDSLKSNTYLETLICENCHLSALDVSANTNLETLDCYSNAIDTLLLPKSLIELNCESNQLTSLDSIIKITSLQSLYCGYNNLAENSTVDFSNMTSLKLLECQGNTLNKITLPSDTALTYLDCSENNLAKLDLSKDTCLTYLNCNTNQLDTLDVTVCPALTTLLARENKLTSIDLSNCTGLEALQLTTNKLTKLDLSNNAALTALTVSANQLDSLDLSPCTNLETVHCSSNKITYLNLGSSSAYTDINFSGNKVTTIDLSNCTKLEKLECQDNSLTSLTLLEGYVPDSIDAHGQRLQAKLYANSTDVYVVFPKGFDSEKVTDSKVNDEEATFTVNSESDGDCDVTVQSGLSGRVKFYKSEDEDGKTDTTGVKWQSMNNALTYNYKYSDNIDGEKFTTMDVKVSICAYTLITHPTYNYASICLPFPYEIADDTKAYTITSKSDELDSDGYTQLVLEEVTGVVPEKTPLIVRSGEGTDGAGNRIVFNMDTVTTPKPVGNNYLSGTLATYTIPTGTTIYAMGVGNSSKKFGFWKYTGTSLAGNLVYISEESMKTLLAGTSSKGFVFVFDDGTSTGIEAVNEESTDSETDGGLWYTIQGVVLPGKPTVSGLYIHNGRKVAIR